MAGKTKTRSGAPLTILKKIAVLCFVCYAVFSLIYHQVNLSEQKEIIKGLKTEVSVAQQQSDEYSRLLNMTNEKEYMERIAIERLGYAYPNERRFYDTSRN
jgi:hypothetical protein